MFYGTRIRFVGFRDQAGRIAGFLEQQCRVKNGDRAAFCMQNFLAAHLGAFSCQMTSYSGFRLD